MERGLLKTFQQNKNTIKKYINSPSNFLAEKHNRKLDSFDAYLFSVVSDLIKDGNTVISNDELGNNILSLPWMDSVAQ